MDPTSILEPHKSAGLVVEETEEHPMSASSASKATPVEGTVKPTVFENSVGLFTHYVTPKLATFGPLSLFHMWLIVSLKFALG